MYEETFDYIWFFITNSACIVKTNNCWVYDESLIGLGVTGIKIYKLYDRRTLVKSTSTDTTAVSMSENNTMRMRCVARVDAGGFS